MNNMNNMNNMKNMENWKMKNNMKKSILFIMTIVYFSTSAYAQNFIRSNIVVDTPTAYTFDRGMYQFSFLGYDSGGVELKSFIGLFDNFYIGISVSVLMYLVRLFMPN